MKSLGFDDEYLRMEAKPYVKLDQTGDRIEGEYPIGRQSGDWDGRLQGAQTKCLRELLKR